MSRYENYDIKNNVFGTLSAPISSLATTIQLNNWQWQRFSVNQLATLENIEDWKVKKREIVLITAINWDVLTVTRKYAPCPADDEANTQWQVSFSFWADDTISAYIDKEHFDKIEAWFENTNDEIDDILENWDYKLRTYKTTWLWVEVKWWPVLIWSAYYDFAWWTLTLTDNATNYIEIDEDWLLVSNTTWRIDENAKISKVTTSWWEVTNIEDWRLGTVWGKIWWVNIHELTEKTNINDNDELILSDSENIRNNKKISYTNLASATLIGKGIAWENIAKWNVVGEINWYIVKISTANQWHLPKQFWIARNDATANDTVYYDITGVSNKVSNLTAWQIYYISSTAWEITTTPWGFIVWKAIDTDKLRMEYSYLETDYWNDITMYSWSNWLNFTYLWNETIKVTLTITYSKDSWNTAGAFYLYVNWTRQTINAGTTTPYTYTGNFTLTNWNTFVTSEYANNRSVKWWAITYSVKEKYI